MKTTRHLTPVLLVLLLGFTSCPDTSPVAPATNPGTVREKPPEDAIDVSFSPSDGRFCCDPNGPFPQTVGTVTLTNTNTRKDSSPIYAYFNFGDQKSAIVDAAPNAFSLKSGESQTVTIIAKSCGFESETMPLEWGYELLKPEIKHDLIVTNACPSASDLQAALTVLCRPDLIDPLFYPAYVVAAVGVLVKHSSILVPAILIHLFYTEIRGYGALPLFLTLLKIAAAFDPNDDDVAFPPGQGPNGYTVYPDMPLPMQEGEYLAVFLEVDQDIPLDDPEHLYQYGFVFDADGVASNNYQPSHPFLNDFFKDTDRWYAVNWSPQNGWHLKVTDASQAGFPEAPTAARVIIRGNAMILVVPTREFSVPRPRYRVTSFAHKGDYGLNPPHEWSGDPTPPVDEPLAEIK